MVLYVCFVHKYQSFKIHSFKHFIFYFISLCIKSEAFHSTHIMHNICICVVASTNVHIKRQKRSITLKFYLNSNGIYSKIAYLFDKNSFMEKKRVVFFYDSDTISYGYLKHICKYIHTHHIMLYNVR